jgi:hypothetical protein
VSDVLVGQARVAFEEKAYQRAEGFLLRVREIVFFFCPEVLFFNPDF